ncbi:MAG: hypothetical protein OHK0028_04350 [Deltaproteobacteria bacterium]
MCPVSLLFVLLFLLTCRSAAADPFTGYTPDVRSQALRVVEAAGPGGGEALDREVRALRKAMFDHGILSINAVPDRIFDRAGKEGWKRHAYESLRAVTRVAPLSISLWAWLTIEDGIRFRIDRVLADVDGLSGALRTYGPGLFGYAAWILLFASAAACWFAVWAAVNLFLRARPALTMDVSRFFKGLPRPEWFASGIVLGCFLLPFALDLAPGIAAVLWIAISAAYVRRTELLIGVAAIVLLGWVFLFGGALQSVQRLTGEVREGGWLGGEGYFPRHWPEPGESGGSVPAGPEWDGMVRFARARAQMQSGNFAAAEEQWTRLLDEGVLPAASANNRGIVRMRLGKIEEGLADFETAMSRSRMPGPAHWNAYQTYLQRFQLDRAAAIQPSAWYGMRMFVPFDYRAEEMTHGEMVASPLRSGDVWNTLSAVRWDWISGAERNPLGDLFFHPIPGRWVPAFLIEGLALTILWKLLSRKIWLHGACRACGTATLVSGNREATDICNSCRAQVGKGIRGGEDRERRALGISLHRRYLRGVSILSPGAGALWAGKEIRTATYGVFLSIFAGLLTVSAGGRAAEGLVADMQWVVWKASLGGVLLLWLFGAVWGWRSFENLQIRHNVSGAGR